MDLDAFRAHLDETERLAKEATPGPWFADDTTVRTPHHRALAYEVLLGDDDTRELYPEALATTSHIAHWQPRAALRWVAAAREILDRHPKIEISGNRVSCDYCYDSGHVGYPCPDVKSIMSVYGDVP